MAALDVELFRTDAYLSDSSVPLLELLREKFEPELGTSLADCRFQVSLIALFDPRELDGAPTMVNLMPDHGYANVRITRHGTLIYSHPHSIRELIGRTLQRRLRGGADDPAPGEHWGYRVVAPGLDGGLVLPAPPPEGEFVLSGSRPRRSRLNMEEVAEPDPPLAGTAELGAPDAPSAADEPMLVILDPGVAEGLRSTTPFSDQVEQGGFLIGRVYRDADAPTRNVVRVEAAVPAERTGASMLHLTFTGESFLRINELVHGRGDDVRLVGWFHTHLFPAGAGFGLSSIDVELHSSIFTLPWQVAALVNLGANERVLRVYRSAGERMAQTRYQVAPR